ncbi:MAG: amino acid racemase [Planctomycetes bacterium]|nr:amino acid racemase [Planctomycetota bacterium]
MAKHIGIVACSAEGAALCYRTICAEAPGRMGKHNHPEITMHTYPLSRYMDLVVAGNWEGVGRLMLQSARKVADAGADFAICPDNTIHQAFEFVAAESPIPWLHIARVVAGEAKRRSLKRLGVLGTKYLMEGPVYSGPCADFGLTCLTPEKSDRREIDRIIFDELVKGEFTEKSRLYFNIVIANLKKRGCRAVVLGCTEIPLLVDPNDCPLPTLDSTRLLARAATDKAAPQS